MLYNIFVPNEAFYSSTLVKESIYFRIVTQYKPFDTFYNPVYRKELFGVFSIRDKMYLQVEYFKIILKGDKWHIKDLFQVKHLSLIS